jgi:outer membrane protein, multidrug efflux system
VPAGGWYLARKRFEAGLIDFLEVLDAERTALSAELLLSQSRTDSATSLIAVYNALGGGWASPAEAASMSPVAANR